MGSDRPRPLPPALRARLEETLLKRTLLANRAASEATGEVAEAGPARDGDEASGAPAGPGQPGELSTPLPPSARSKLESRLLGRARRRRWQAFGVLGVAAAAVVAVVAVISPGTTRPPVAAPYRALHTRSAAGLAPGLAPPKSRDDKAAQPRGAPLDVTAGGAHAARAERGQAAAGQGNQGNKATPSAVGSGPLFGPSKKPLVLARNATAPDVSALSPTTGPSAGGNWVVVHGKELGDSPVVYFGTAKAARVRDVSTSELEAKAPAHAPGTVMVLVVTPAGKSAAGAGGRYTFSKTGAGTTN